MSDRAAFLEAIRQHPEEDTPRLVYADWLQENGDDARAELIRVQIALARVSGPDPMCLSCYGGGGKPVVKDGKCTRVPCRTTPVEKGCYGKLHKRDEDLRQFVSRSITPRVSFPSNPYGWDRGFLSGVVCYAATWVDAAGDIVRREWVPKVTLIDCGTPYRTRTGKYRWWPSVAADDTPSTDDGDNVPRCIYKFLNEVYPNKQSALDAISPACLAYGQEQALKLTEAGVPL